jgi:hypothetical protein
MLPKVKPDTIRRFNAAGSVSGFGLTTTAGTHSPISDGSDTAHNKLSLLLFW